MNLNTIPHNLKDSERLWRYMDLTKFALLINQKKLWFSRSDLLGDDHEGSLPDSYIKIREEKWQHKDSINRLERGSKEGRKDYFISCWTMQNPSSLSMWKIYTTNQTGVAIETTVGGLSNSFAKIPHEFFERYQAKIMAVEYIDFDKEDTLYNQFDRFIHKQKAYAYEKEVRMLIFSSSTVDKPPIGKELDVDLDVLIKKIYVSYKQGDDFMQYVKGILKNNGINKEVVCPPFVRKPSRLLKNVFSFE